MGRFAAGRLHDLQGVLTYEHERFIRRDLFLQPEAFAFREGDAADFIGKRIRRGNSQRGAGWRGDLEETPDQPFDDRVSDSVPFTLRRSVEVEHELLWQRRVQMLPSTRQFAARRLSNDRARHF